jgi:hypothetical protein
LEPSTLLAIIIIAVLYLLLRGYTSSKQKGINGERRVARRLRRLNKRDYLVINDILLKSGGYSTQIDHIVICRSGIIVIETKNYTGWIHGHENSEYWLQTIYKNKYQLKNPIKQNWVHVYTLRKLLKQYGTIQYHPIVVFAGDGTLKNVTSNLPVIYSKKLLRTIKSINHIDNLTYDQMQAIFNDLLSMRLTSSKENRSHIKYVKQRAREQRRVVKKKLCPKCGGKLVKRKGKYGSFYGCNNFPRCKYTLNIK